MSFSREDPIPKEDESAWFAGQVMRHSPSLHAYLRSLFPKIRDVEDVLQETFLRFWKVRNRSEILSPRAFLFRISRNIAIDQIRRSQASPIDELRDLESLNVSDIKEDVLSTVSVHEKALLLAQAIDSLPARCREVVVLRKLHQLSQKEVAQRLAISEKTVEAHLSRGIRKCEEFLKKRGWSRLFDV